MTIHKNHNLVCGDEIFKNTKQEKVLGLTLNNKLNFATHLLSIAKNANKNFNALTRVQKCTTTDQEKLIVSFFIKLQFTYCPLIWMFCTKRSLRRIGNIHERCLRLMQQNYRSDLNHKKCIEFLSIEVYKYLNGLSPDIINSIFKLIQNTYNLRNFDAFESQNPRTKKFGLDSIACRASQLWKNIPEEIRS